MSETAIRLINAWLPFILLLAVWVFFMVRIRGSTPIQKKLLDSNNAQLEAQRDIARNLDRIATALEQRQP